MPRPSPRVLAGAVLLSGATVLAYLPALGAGYIWDDDVYLTRNPTLQGTEGLKRIWSDPHANPQYYPLVFTTFWIEQRLWGLRPAPYHLFNVLLHALSAVLVWRILRQLSVPGAWAAAAIFALHPLQVESVAWITERKNVLAGVFYLAALAAYLRFSPLTDEGMTSRRSWPFYALALVLFVCALLSKTVACSLPAAILLLAWWKRGRIRARDVLALAPFFLIGLALGLHTASLEREHVGAAGVEWSLSFVERFLVAGRALCFYAGKLVWPSSLTFIYPRWHIDASSWPPYLYPAAVIAILGCLWAQRRRIGRGPLAAALFFAGTLAPALGFFNVYPMRYSFVADHFQYLASLGLITLAVGASAVALRRANSPSGPASGAARARSRKRSSPRPAWITPQAAITAALLSALGALTWRQCQVYRDAETLWRDTLAKNPSAWLAHTNLANIVIRGGDRSKLPVAETHYDEALRLNPRFAQAHVGKGTVLGMRGQLDEAIRHFQEAARLKPNLAEAHSNLGLAYLQRGQAEEAMTHLERAVELSPGNALLHRNLAVGLKTHGQMERAIEAFREALRRAPEGQAQIHFELGELLRQQGRIEEAAEEYREAVRADPSHARSRQALEASARPVKP